MSVDPSNGGDSGGLPGYVTQNYYRYGLMVATHPWKIIFLATAIFLCISTPLYYLPLPGYLSQEYMTDVYNYSVPPIAGTGGLVLDPSPMPKPLWYQGPPTAYIQQIIVRSGLDPDRKSDPSQPITVSDSYRGPLATVFDLYQMISNYHTDHNKKSESDFDKSLTNECLLVDDVAKQHRKEGGKGLLPHFNCLLLSPADLWARDKNEFLRDPHVLTTVKSLMASYEGQTKVANILFGVPSSEVGLNKKHHPKVITYALTIALKNYSEGFLDGLRNELMKKHPLHNDMQPTRDQMIHLYFPGQLSPFEVLIILFYFCLFLSIYYSLRKIDMLSSNIGVSIAVLVTHISSFCLAIGACAYFGLKPLHTQKTYLYPLLAGLVGFENSMVLIRCIASIPQHLDVKIRVARGLANEGWTITKYFLIMITLVTFSFFLFIPIVQEICIYGSLVLLCDLYMQLVFLTAVISIDIQKRQESNKSRKREVLATGALSNRQAPIKIVNSEVNIPGRTGIPNLHRRNAHFKSTHGEDRMAPPSSIPTKADTSIPKRLRITYFVASKRMFQRMFICCFVGWITWTIYSSTGLPEFLERSAFDGPGLASVIKSIKIKSSEHYFALYNMNLTDSAKYSKKEKPLYSMNEEANVANLKSVRLNEKLGIKSPDSQVKSPASDVNQAEVSFGHLRHHCPGLTDYLPESHWSTLFGYYNISLAGQYLTVLPPILLSIPVSVEDALAVHNSDDPNNGLWYPPPEKDTSDGKIDSVGQWWVDLMTTSYRGKSHPNDRRIPFIPKSSGEVVVSGILAIPALLVITYCFVWMYRCVCSRHYAEWREQWWTGEEAEARAQIIGECIPVALYGHQADIECISTDGNLVASSCLSGLIKVWDPVTAECINTLKRTSRKLSDSLLDEEVPDYDSSSPRSQSECSRYSSNGAGSIWSTSTNMGEFEVTHPSTSNNLPDFSSSINTNFMSMYSTRNSIPTDNHIQKSDFKEIVNNAPNAFRRNYSYDSLHQKPDIKTSSPFYDQTHKHNPVTFKPFQKSHRRNWSADSGAQFVFQKFGKDNSNTLSTSNSNLKEINSLEMPSSSVWALQCQDGLIFAGCSDGSIEVWDGYSGSLKYVTTDGEGVTHLAVSGSKLVVARLSGFVDMYTIHVTDIVQPDANNYSDFHPTATNRKHNSSNHKRTHSYDKGVQTEKSLIDDYDYEICLIKDASRKAHHQPISVLCSDDIRVLTGSLDHTIKVFELKDARNIFTLHGHMGPITTATIGGPVINSQHGGDAIVNINEVNLEGTILATGAQDGSLCVWDAVTGACVYSVTGHCGAVVSIVTSSSYLISLGNDNKIAVWERFQGHLLNTLLVSNYCSSILMLTSKLLITTRQGRLCVTDVSSGLEVLEVSLGESEVSVLPRHLLAVGANIICDYGNSLRAVKMPVAEKMD